MEIDRTLVVYDRRKRGGPAIVLVGRRHFGADWVAG